LLRNQEVLHQYLHYLPYGPRIKVVHLFGCPFLESRLSAVSYSSVLFQWGEEVRYDSELGLECEFQLGHGRRGNCAEMIREVYGDE